jgi:hypothetical protein
VSDPSSHLIEQSIEQLERLSELLAGEVPSNSRSAASLSRRVRLSKETLLTISVLLPKLHEVREAHRMPSGAARICPGCED